MTRRDLILTVVEDLVSSFLYYDRKEDDDLPRDGIDEAVAAGEITTEEIVEHFRAALETGLGCTAPSE